MISRMDLIRSLVTHRREANEVVADEEVLREHILEDIAAQDWADGVVVDVSVRNGVVDVWGTVLEVDQAERCGRWLGAHPACNGSSLI
jgi:hypothetical protein